MQNKKYYYFKDDDIKGSANVFEELDNIKKDDDFDDDEEDFDDIKDSKDDYFVDKWCARNIRKVKNCTKCMHCEECTKAGHSLAPSAIEHAKGRKR